MRTTLLRREFLIRSGQAGLAWMAASLPASASTASLPNPVGYATISWPRNQFEQALETISSLHYQGAQLLGWVADDYAGSKQAELREKLQSLHITPVALSCWGVTLDPANLGPVSSKFAAYMQGPDYVQWHGVYPLLKQLSKVKEDALALRAQKREGASR